MTWIDICALDDIPLRGARKLKTELGCVAVFRTEVQQVYAIADTCPHKGGPLSEGIVHGTAVTCPLHNWVFDLNTGQAVGEDASVETFPLRIDAGRVLIDSARLRARSAA